ncbi:hypothetical protein [Selenomonas ruminis]|uniref:DUF748 domain-containing protein n=1 Tax=Selenomonas ruminis TaxID=2593411 RepID=A0A5D6WAR5_9FIRM|nr:hypothetical protein [Selenomonas sp. mPRGC5]TYZ25006.1 hypothetical protein FZ040_02975 [Selenomonas sp. mPRGC5]
MLKWLRMHWRRTLVIAVVTISLAVFIVLEIFSRGAAAIFNQAMAEQNMLRGTITAEKIIAHVTGDVDFTGLEWHDVEGRLILRVPEGHFYVRLWDVVTGNIKSTTLQELTLKDAEVSIHLADDMTVDFVRNSKDMQKVQTADEDWQQKVSLVGKSEEERKRIGEFHRRKRAEKMAKQWKNFDRSGKKIRMELKLEDCRLEVFYKDRHYLLSGVNVKTAINTAKRMEVEVNTGRFGGTMIGSNVNLKGTVDFQDSEVPIGDLQLSFVEVDPSSLGVGVKVHDKMTLDSHLTGPLNAIHGEGKLKMAELHIPGLYFQEVNGNISYDGEKIDFKDVTGKVYGGKLEAEGSYDLDTRYYTIHAVGRELQASQALPHSHLYCNVMVDMQFASKGSAKEATASGIFTSGDGRYRRIPIKRIKGAFRQSYHELQFYDVRIDFAGFSVATDALQIKDKKLRLGPIFVKDSSGKDISTLDLGRK